MNTPTQSKKFVVLRGIKHGNKFYTMNDPASDPTKSAKGETWYEVLGYADTSEEAEKILFPNPGDADKALNQYAAKMIAEIAVLTMAVSQ